MLQACSRFAAGLVRLVRADVAVGPEILQIKYVALLAVLRCLERGAGIIDGFAEGILLQRIGCGLLEAAGGEPPVAKSLLQLDVDAYPPFVGQHVTQKCGRIHRRASQVIARSKERAAAEGYARGSTREPTPSFCRGQLEQAVEAR